MSASEDLKQHIESIDSYLNETNTRFASFKEEFLLLADMDQDQLKKMTQQEIFDAGYSLYGYSSYIQDEVNRNKIALIWCNENMERLIAQHSEMFGQYTKHESKKHILSKENSYAAKLEQMRLIAESRLQCLEGKSYELKRKADILLEKGKRS